MSFRMLSKPVETHSAEEFKRPSDQLFAKEAEYCLLACSPLKKTRKINKGRTDISREKDHSQKVK